MGVMPPDEREYLATWDSYHERAMWLSVIERGGDEKVAASMMKELPTVGPLDALAANRALVDLLTGRRWYVIQAAREAGETWEAIGAALGVSKQGAQDYYRRKIEQRERYLDDSHDVDRGRAALERSEAL